MNGNDSIYALTAEQERECSLPGGWGGVGLTKRELFAAMAMQGFAACVSCNGTIEAHAEYAVKWADALLAELAKEPK